MPDFARRQRSAWARTIKGFAYAIFERCGLRGPLAAMLTGGRIDDLCDRCNVNRVTATANPTGMSATRWTPAVRWQKAVGSNWPETGAPGRPVRVPRDRSAAFEFHQSKREVLVDGPSNLPARPDDSPTICRAPLLPQEALQRSLSARRAAHACLRSRQCSPGQRRH
jgi:hypothetical protein